MIADKPGFGFGTHVDENGRYEGDHENYDRHGKGTLSLRDGTVLIGSFVRGKQHGIFMKKTTDNKYFYQNYNNNQLESETPSDRLNFDNFFLVR